MSLFRKGSTMFHLPKSNLNFKEWFPFLISPRFFSEEVKTAQALRSIKPKSVKNTMQHHIDYYHVRTQGGKGGNGKISFLSAWLKEFAGPDGADGGNGGHVVFFATSSVKGFNYVTSVVVAEDGDDGGNKDRTGKNAKNAIINVPVGTIIKDANGKVIGDLHVDRMMFVAARGGAGGKGNKFFTTDIEQAPRIAELGADGEKKTYLLELRSMANIGLIGFPNAGKSTLLRAVTRARPRVAPYPFTTIKPYLGTVLYDDHQQLTIADLPGLIDGSHKNRGLGIQFLQHAERCTGLLYIVDASLPKPWKQIEKLQYEISKFNGEMLERPYLIAANKIDIDGAKENIEGIEKYFKGSQVIPISAKQGTNLLKLLDAIRKIYDASEESQKVDLWV